MGGLFSQPLVPAGNIVQSSNDINSCNILVKTCNTDLKICTDRQNKDTSSGELTSLQASLDQCNSGSKAGPSSNILLIIVSFITFISILINLYYLFKLLKAGSSGDNDVSDSVNDVSY